MRKISALTAALILAGCASAGYQGMSPEQIVAIGKIKDASINYVRAPTPWGQAVTVFVNLDKGVLPSGTVSVDQEGKITIQAAPLPAPVK